jgi:hypothetical protein
MTPNSADLALSLLFAVGQMVAGGVVTWLIGRSGAWRRGKYFLLALLALWFVASGITELIVSGAEVLHATRGYPGVAQFAAVRARADEFLVAVTVALVVIAGGGLIWLAVSQKGARAAEKR